MIISFTAHGKIYSWVPTNVAICTQFDPLLAKFMAEDGCICSLCQSNWTSFIRNIYTRSDSGIHKIQIGICVCCDQVKFWLFHVLKFLSIFIGKLYFDFTNFLVMVWKIHWKMLVWWHSNWIKYLLLEGNFFLNPKHTHI